MRKIGEFPGLRTKGERLIAAAGLLIGAAGVTGGLAASGALEATASKPAPQEVPTAYPDEVFQIAGQLCVDGTVFGAVHGKVEPLPNSDCSENTTNGDATVNNDITVRNNGNYIRASGAAASNVVTSHSVSVVTIPHGQ